MSLPPSNKPRIQGNTLFLGDSITVGMPGFVGVDGQTSILAEGGKTADWLLGKLRGIEKLGALDGPDRPQNVVVLIGTNDVGGGRSIQAIFSDITAIWSIARDHGARVVAVTLPPFKGWANYGSRYGDINARRMALNALIVTSSIPDQTVLLDRLVADPADPERLAKSYDGGDHLHLQKPALAALLQAQIVGGGRGIPQPVSPVGPARIEPPTPAGGSLLSYLLVGLAAVSGIAVLTRKRNKQT